MAELNIHHADLALQSDFAEPAFAVFADTARLYRELYQRLSPFGLSLSDVRWEGQALGDLRVWFYLFQYLFVVTLRLERLELQVTEVIRRDVANIAGAASGLFSAVAAAGGPGFKTHNLTVNAHGVIEGGDAQSLIGTFTRPGPTSLGQAAGAGVAFYYGPSGALLMSAITLDRSGLVPEGLLFRVHTVWDGAKVQPSELSATAKSHFFKAVDSFGLGAKSEATQ